MENKSGFYKAFFLILLGIIVFLMIRKFIPGILSAFVISFFMLPVFKRIDKRLSSRVAAFIVVFFIITALFVIIYLLSSSLARQATQFLNEPSQTIDVFLVKMESISPTIGRFFSESSAGIKSVLLNLSLTLVKDIPNIAINVLLSVFISYYLLLYWDEVSSFFLKAIPFKNRILLSQMKISTYNIVYGLSIIAAIEFIISAVGLYLAGIRLYLFFALIIAVAAFIPFFGPITVWLPLLLYQIVVGNTQSAIIILIMGLILTIGIDNLLTHVIVGRRSQINPVFMILGVLGGVALFGIFGFIIGPLLIIAFIDFYGQYLDEINAGWIEDKGGATMPPRGVKSPKRERQYEHIKESEEKRGRPEKVAKRIAAATVNKTRRKKGETKKR